MLHKCWWNRQKIEHMMASYAFKSSFYEQASLLKEDICSFVFLSILGAWEASIVIVIHRRRVTFLKGGPPIISWSKSTFILYCNYWAASLQQTMYYNNHDCGQMQF
jgi:hypothetical protein